MKRSRGPKDCRQGLSWEPVRGGPGPPWFAAPL